MNDIKETGGGSSRSGEVNGKVSIEETLKMMKVIQKKE